MNGRRFFTTLIFLTTLTACALPGLSTPTALQPALTVDTGSLETMVAATVSAVVAQTEQFAPSQAPAAVVIVTAVSSATPIPTSTSTPTPVPEPTATSTPKAESPSKSTLTQQDDGSLLFVDDLAGYQIKLPSGGLVVRVNEKEYLDAFSLEQAANQHVQQSLLGVQTEDPNVLRLFIIDATPEHIQNEFVSDARFVLDNGKNISLNSNADLQAIAEKIPTSATVFRFEVISVKIFTSGSGMQFGVIETQSSFTNNVGANVPLYQKQVFFNTKGGLQSITLTTLNDLKSTLLPFFDAMIETVALLTEME